MATSPHQPESLSDEITSLKAELAELRAARSQVLTLGQAAAGGGISTTYPTLTALDARIDWLVAKIKAKVDQLHGDTANVQPGVNTVQFVGDYS